MDTNKIRYLLRQISDDLREYNDNPMAIEEDLLCTGCMGSGEGQYDGTSCRQCKGSGIEKGETNGSL